MFSIADDEGHVSRGNGESGQQHSARRALLASVKENPMQKNKEFLGTEPVGKLLFRLSVPTVVAQIINMLYNIVDRVYIGRIPDSGSLALTGVGVCMPIIILVSAFAALAGSGGAPRASIFMGKEDMKSAEKTLGGCFTLLIGLSVVLTTVLLIWNRQLLMIFGASSNTIEYAVSYMNIYALGTVFVLLTMGLNAFITAQGNTKIGMLTVLIGAVSNIILDPLFIFACNMGVRGAALATIISQGISCIWCVLFLCGKRTLFKLKKENLLVGPGIILPCIALGISAFVMQSSESIIYVCFNASLLKYGGDMAVGAMTICSSIMQFINLPMLGISQGAQPISSYNFGSRNAPRVKKVFRLLLTCCLVYSMTMWSLIMLFPRIFAGIFTPNIELLDFAAPVVRIYCACLGLFGIQVACQMTFVSIGNAPCSILVAVVRKFALLLPLIYIMPKLVSNPTMGVYMAEPAADIIAIVFTTILFFVQFKTAIRKLQQPEANA